MKSKQSIFITADNNTMFNMVNLYASNGRFFTAKFIKQDGTARTITGRTGVKKHTRGTGVKYDRARLHHIIIFETGAGNSPIPMQYRTICTDRLFYFKQGRVIIKRDIDAGYLLDS